MVIASIVVPILNEEKYITEFLYSLEKQDYPKEKMEIFLIDGNSNDKTVEKINNYLTTTNLNIKLLTNSKKIQASAMNIGIKKSNGKYIIRLDCHAIYEKNYISECVKLLGGTDAKNVGFYIETKGRGKTGKIIAKVLSSKFGVGASKFRTTTTKDEVETDTVPFGAFKKEIFDEIGLFNENLVCNEDNDINYRITNAGYKILISSKSKSTYFCRDTIKALTKMAIRNGKWNVYSLYYSKGNMSIKYFIPAIFTLGFITLPLLNILNNIFIYLFFLEIAMYILAATYFSLKLKENFKEFIFLISTFFIFHFTYGLGSVVGIYNYFKKSLVMLRIRKMTT